MSKHSNVYYTYKRDSGFVAVEKAKAYKNDLGLDLFTYNGFIYEGQTGISMCGADTDLKSLITKNGGIIAVNDIISSHISRTGKSPRYTRPNERKKDVFPKKKDENIVFAKDAYGKKHYFYRIYNENGIELYTLDKVDDMHRIVFVFCEGYMVDVGNHHGFNELIERLAGFENGVKGEIERLFNESMANPAKIADIGFANVLGRYDEAVQHNKPVIEARKLENQRIDAERKARQATEENAEKERYEQAIKTAENHILNREKVDNVKITGKSLIMQLFKEYNITVSLKTQGWIINSLHDIYCNENHSCWSYHYIGNDSTVFFDYLEKLVTAVLTKSNPTAA